MWVWVGLKTSNTINSMQEPDSLVRIRFISCHVAYLSMVGDDVAWCNQLNWSETCGLAWHSSSERDSRSAAAAASPERKATSLFLLLQALRWIRVNPTVNRPVAMWKNLTRFTGNTG
jgi:hypothetical protein